MPDAPGLELIMGEINDAYAGAVLDTSFDREQAALIVNPAEILNVLSWLKETPGQEYRFLASVHGADYLPGTPRFAVHYELVNRDRYERLRVKAVLPDPAAGDGAAAVGDVSGRLSPGFPATSPTAATPPAGSVAAEKKTDADRGEADSSGEADAGNGSESVASDDAGAAGGPGGIPGVSLPAESPQVTGSTTLDGERLPCLPSCVGLFPTADFQEREVYDFFGIVFDGHPDLRRILMPEDYVGWPQRRDFPVGGEPVVFTRDDVTNPGWWE